jgi:hypothetical protein
VQTRRRDDVSLSPPHVATRKAANARATLHPKFRIRKITMMSAAGLDARPVRERSEFVFQGRKRFFAVVAGVYIQDK